jgi:hypothetical protein
MSQNKSSARNYLQHIQLKWHWIAMVLILVIGIGLRLWGLKFGLPYQYHVDEEPYMVPVWKLASGQIDLRLATFSLLTFIVRQSWGIIHTLTRLPGPSAWFSIKVAGLNGNDILIGRLVSAILGAATALPVYWIGRRWWNQTAGVIAAALMSVAFLYVRNSHYAVPDVTGTFFITLSAYLCIQLSPTAPKRYFFLAGVYAGLALSTRLTAAVLIVPIFLYNAFSTDETAALDWHFHWIELTGMWKWIRQHILTSRLIIAAFGMGIAFLLSTPPVWLMPLEYARTYWHEFQLGKLGGFGEFRVVEGSGWLFYLDTLRWGLGNIWFVLSLVGLFWIFLNRRKAILFLYSFPILYYVSMGSTGHAFARYALPLIPFLALSTGGFIWQAAHWLYTHYRWPIGFVVAIGGLLWGLSSAQSLISDSRHNYLLTQVDTRTQAKLWIESNLPEGTHIATEWHTPALDDGSGKIPLSTRSYNVWLSSVYGLSDFPLDHYCQDKFDYLITSSFIRDIPMILPTVQSKKQDFYDTLDHNEELLAEFNPFVAGSKPIFHFEELYGPALDLFKIVRPGPVIRIYGLNCGLFKLSSPNP